MDKRGGENGRGERFEEGYCGNKINLMVGESSGSKGNVYHYIIYWCYQGLIVFR